MVVEYCQCVDDIPSVAPDLLTRLVDLLKVSLYNYLASFPQKNKLKGITVKGAQWLSGRVLDSRPRTSGFEPHQRHCVVVLEQDTFILAYYWFNPGRPVPV